MLGLLPATDSRGIAPQGTAARLRTSIGGGESSYRNRIVSAVARKVTPRALRRSCGSWRQDKTIYKTIPAIQAGPHRV